MPEIGLPLFSRAAMEVAGAVLPPYRRGFCKHPLAQLRLLTILSLMRYQDGTFRKAGVRLLEAHELR